MIYMLHAQTFQWKKIRLAGEIRYVTTDMDFL